jgi:vancomycin resistance protein YoaR
MGAKPFEAADSAGRLGRPMRADAALSPARQPRPDLDERRRAKARAVRLRRRAAIGAAVTAVAVVIGAGMGFAGSSDRIASGITIAGVDVSGMTAAEARAALDQRAAELSTEPVVFTVGGESITLRPKRLGIQTNWQTAVESALDEGGGFVLFRGFKRIALRLSGSDIAPAVAASDAALDRQLDRLASRIDRAPKEASIVLEGLEPVVARAQTGVELDRDGAAAVLLSALGSFERGQPIALPTRVAQPEVTAAELAPVAERLRTVLSGPVELTFRKTSVRLGPKKLASFLVLPSGGTTELGIGSDAATKYFAGVAKALDREPESARFTLDSNGKIRIVPAKDGRALDVKATERALLAAALLPTGRTDELVVETAKPRISTEKAKGMGIVGVVGSYTTTYGGEPNRLANVQLVSRLLDDHLIAPGQVFSFNETTGERNAETGFLEAPVIINGELQTGIGGGVCQVSTTVFNAAFEAGLSIEERTNHALYISHYPTARDATVNYPDLDLKFRNDTGHWLWLRTFVGSGSLTVNLYGTPVDRRVEFETSPLEVTGSVPVRRIDDPNLYKGETYVEDSGEPPRSVSVRRIVYGPDGEVLYDTTWYSRYDAEPKIVHVGTKPRPEEPAPAPAEEEQPPADTEGSTPSTSEENQGATQDGAQTETPPAEGPAQTEPPVAETVPVIGA